MTWMPADPQPNIEVLNPPRDADDKAGLFRVTVITRRQGRPSNRVFLATSSLSLDIRQETAKGLATARNFVPSFDGIYQLFIGFEGAQATVSFIADNGEQAIVCLRK